MNTNEDNLKHIRSMMERSTKFLSLSGMSAVAAGIFALIGATVAYFILYRGLVITPSLEFDLLLVAGFVLAGAAMSGLYFSTRKAKKNEMRFWMPVTIQIMKDAGVPMIVGGLFCLILIYNNASHMIGAAMLVFYGIGLINAGAHTYSGVKILGVCEIVLGLLAGILVKYDLLLWAVGFGVLHILYGIAIYLKYDVKSNKSS